MDPLDELLTLPAWRRRLRLGHADVRDALVARGTRDGIGWLERHIESPIGPEWGHLLYALQPTWDDLDRWIHHSKLHLLAAIDAIVLFAGPPDERDAAVMPHGADAQRIDDAVAFALAENPSPRVREAAKRIRYAWPLGPLPRHEIFISGPLKDLARRLLAEDLCRLGEWEEMLATAMDAPEDPWISGTRYSCLAIGRA